MHNKTPLTLAQVQEIKERRRKGDSWRTLTQAYHIGNARLQRLVANVVPERPSEKSGQLTPEQVRRIRFAWAANPYGVPLAEFAAKNGITVGNLTKVLQFRTHKNAGGPHVPVSVFNEVRRKHCLKGHDKTKQQPTKDGHCRECAKATKAAYNLRVARESWKLTTKVVIEMRESYAYRGESVKAIAARLGYDKSLVSGVVHGKRWKDAPGPITPVLTEEFRQMVIEMRTDYHENPRELTFDQIGAQYGINPRTARAIIVGDTYRDLPGPITRASDVKEFRKHVCKHGHKLTARTRRKDGTCLTCRRESTQRYDSKRRGERHGRKASA